MSNREKSSVSRRNFLGGTAAGAVGSTMLGVGSAGAHPGVDGLDLTVNGQLRRVTPHPDASLADMLRDTLSLTGTKIGCGVGSCGACAVHVNGKLVRSCTMPATAAAGATVLTIEGLEKADGTLHPLQEAFIQKDALQCGYCTPGQIMTGLACIQAGRARSADTIRSFMNDSLCRCGAHAQIVAAILSVAKVTERTDE